MEAEQGQTECLNIEEEEEKDENSGLIDLKVQETTGNSVVTMPGLSWCRNALKVKKHLKLAVFD